MKMTTKVTTKATTATIDAHEAFRKELTDLLNKYNLDEESNTPDYILADLLLSVYDSYTLHVTRRDETFSFTNAENEDDEDEDDDTNERGFIVIKDEKPIPKHIVFVEWRNKRPVYSNCADYAMIFTHREMAEHVAGKLGDDWYVLDLDELERDSKATERLLKAIFRDDDDDEE